MTPDINPDFAEITKEDLPRLVEETRREAAEVIAAGIRELIAEAVAKTGRQPAPGLEAALLEKAMALYDSQQEAQVAQIERNLDGTTLQ